MIEITIKQDISIPIYAQIKDQIKDAILHNKLTENDILPSIRVLSKQLDIGILTVRRAYDELEEEGYLVSRRGRGSFVTLKNIESLKETRLKMIEEKLNEIYEISKTIGIPAIDLKAAINFFIDEKSKDR